MVSHLRSYAGNEHSSNDEHCHFIHFCNQDRLKGEIIKALYIRRIDGYDREKESEVLPLNKLTTLILALQSLHGIGDKSIAQILLLPIAPEQMLADFHLAIPQDTRTKNQFKKLEEQGTLTLQTWSEMIAKAQDSQKSAAESGITILNPRQAEYPQRLLAWPTHPPLLYVKGNVAALNQDKIAAVIGTRKPTSFGAKMGDHIAQLLVHNGYVVVSGLAVGSDTAGHRGALAAGGVTVAVLAHGLNCPVYPKQNAPLAKKILDNHGALVSTYAPNVPLQRTYLVQRDEWQAALSDGVIALETGVTGGTTHALNAAWEQNLPVGMLDYQQKFSAEELTQMPNLAGNVQFIQDRSATGLYSSESILKFCDAMQATHQKRHPVAAPKMTTPTQFEQGSLF